MGVGTEHIGRKFDGELNLAVWQSGLKPPKYNTIIILFILFLLTLRLGPNHLNTANISGYTVV